MPSPKKIVVAALAAFSLYSCTEEAVPPPKPKVVAPASMEIETFDGIT